jgi:hypothetical protein
MSVTTTRDKFAFESSFNRLKRFCALDAPAQIIASETHILNARAHQVAADGAEPLPVSELHLDHFHHATRTLARPSAARSSAPQKKWPSVRPSSSL